VVRIPVILQLAVKWFNHLATNHLKFTCHCTWWFPAWKKDYLVPQVTHQQRLSLGQNGRLWLKFIDATT